MHQKHNHYVPKVYLKRWSFQRKGKKLIYSLNLKNKLIRSQPTNEVCKKKNLYTIPSSYGLDENKISEKFLYKIWEDRWQVVLAKTLDKGLIPRNEELGDIMAFIIVQSMRSLKFKNDSQALINKIASDELKNIDFTLSYAYLAIQGYTDLINNCTIELYKANLGKRFITTDNPATHWIVEGKLYTNIKSLIRNMDVLANPNYKIICPITPYWLGILTPNLGIPVTVSQRNTCNVFELSLEEINIFNTLLENTSHEMIFAKSLNDFIK
ncbi:MAG: DUF4238 domain-containing protein [Sporocytophaga sp.]|uniref:DUF4238 domain-containing protein n=1 Tax=Sporocytophaga sp. TaxID=2231183 RepID=UPI001AFDD304|nr:DUF4238 domain-containing protein [Sporocytophaga sp.]MBO9698627.1 DUF4238 domain-containing protein [Sporocytophaga sp.]